MKKNNLLNFARTAFVLLSVSVMMSCGDNKGGNNSAPPVPVVIQPPIANFQQCVNCQSLTGPMIFTAESLDFTSTIHLNWYFTSQGGLATSTPGTYYGMVGAAGQIVIAQGLNLGYCQLPAGTYTLATVQAGQWAYGIASGLILQAIGTSGSIMMGFNGQISSPGYLQSGQVSSSTIPVGRMFGNLQIQAVNGYNCQSTIAVQ
jgi:hypothetical protein